MPNESQIVVLYDGDCALCHFWVRFASEKGNGRFLFIPRQLTDEPGIENSMIVYLPTGVRAIRSDAVVRILKQLDTPWSLLARVLRAFPQPLRDLGYRIVSRVRKRIFGKTQSICPIVPDRLRKNILSDKENAQQTLNSYRAPKDETGIC